MDADRTAIARTHLDEVSRRAAAKVIRIDARDERDESGDHDNDWRHCEKKTGLPDMALRWIDLVPSKPSFCACARITLSGSGMSS